MTDEDIDPAMMRKQYRSEIVEEGSLAENPMDQFALWFQQAADSHLFEPNAMVVSTATPTGSPVHGRC